MWSYQAMLNPLVQTAVGHVCYGLPPASILRWEVRPHSYIQGKRALATRCVELGFSAITWITCVPYYFMFHASLHVNAGVDGNGWCKPPNESLRAVLAAGVYEVISNQIDDFILQLRLTK